MNISMMKKESKMNISMMKEKKGIYWIANGMYKNDVWKISNIECKSLWTENNVSKANEISWEEQTDRRKMNEH